MLLLESVACTKTMVRPTGNSCPDVALLVTLIAPFELSETFQLPHSTDTGCFLGLDTALIVGGHVSSGAFISVIYRPYIHFFNNINHVFFKFDYYFLGLLLLEYSISN